VVVEDTQAESPLQLGRPDERTLLVRLAGSWTVHGALPGSAEVERAMDTSPRPERVTFDAARLGRWDSGLLTFLLAVREAALARKIAFDPAGLPQGCRA
jgi:hypothetical protein